MSLFRTIATADTAVRGRYAAAYWPTSTSGRSAARIDESSVK
jgi:hypothetical protein